MGSLDGIIVGLRLAVAELIKFQHSNPINNFGSISQLDKFGVALQKVVDNVEQMNDLDEFNKFKEFFNCEMDDAQKILATIKNPDMADFGSV